MTTRYLKLPGKLEITNADDGSSTVVTPSGERVPILPSSHEEVCRALTMQLRVDDALDVLDCMALREKLMRSAGSVVELSETEHAALVKAVKNPRGLSMHAQFSPSVVAFLRSIVDAPSAPPKAKG